ncbi:MAG: nucleotidyltransferase family protein [Actinomycetaceae bacterium]|nr:nucleotidyltransferase family protein [Actinomycetaceae bacterium]
MTTQTQKKSCSGTALPPITKAVVLARGLGTRMRADDPSADLTDEQAKVAAQGAKGMIDVGRPFLDYVISALGDAGITDICLVIGPEHDVFRNYYGKMETTRLRLHFAIQEEPLGTANAVQAAESFADDNPIIVVNSDNYYPANALATLVRGGGSGVIGFERQAMINKSNIPADRITAFAILDVDDKGHMKGILEKPSQDVLKAHPSAPLSMNAWAFSPLVFEACRSIEKSERGEYEIIDAADWMTEHGEVFPVYEVEEGVLDMSRRTDIQAVKDALKDIPVTL